MSDDVNDGSDYPLGHQSDDGELEVRERADGSRGFVETELGQHQRWMRQAPDLYALYQDALARLADRPTTTSITIDPLEWLARQGESTDVGKVRALADRMHAEIKRVTALRIQDRGPLTMALLQCFMWANELEALLGSGAAPLREKTET